MLFLHTICVQHKQVTRVAPFHEVKPCSAVRQASRYQGVARVACLTRHTIYTCHPCGGPVMRWHAAAYYAAALLARFLPRCRCDGSSCQEHPRVFLIGMLGAATPSGNLRAKPASIFTLPEPHKVHALMLLQSCCTYGSRFPVPTAPTSRSARTLAAPKRSCWRPPGMQQPCCHVTARLRCQGYRVQACRLPSWPLQNRKYRGSFSGKLRAQPPNTH